MKKRIVVCGCRHFSDKQLCFDTLDELLRGETDVEIVSGHAKGADLLAEAYAKERGIALKVFPAQWDRYGKGAGPVRNKEMLEYAREADPLVVAFWDGESPGTAHMMRIAAEKGVKVRIVWIPGKKKSSHTGSDVDGDDRSPDSKKHGCLSRKEPVKLFDVISLSDFIDLCRDRGLAGVEAFFEENGIDPDAEI